MQYLRLKVEIVELFVRKFNFLLTLPLKCLLRFKFVLRSWLNEITSQTLNDSNRCLLITPTQIYTYGFSSAFNVREIPPPPPRGAYCIGCCNGLLCFDDPFQQHISLYNPTTRACKNVPYLEKKNLSNPYDYYRHRIGFGYDHKSNDFKILKLVPDRAYIYRLRNGSWDDIELNGKDYYGSDPRTRRYIIVSNNALHWKHRRSSIRALDLGTHEFYKVPLPDGIIRPSEASYTYWDFTDLNGRLHLVKCKFEEGLSWTDRKVMGDCHISMEIWIMMEYGVKESWTKLLQYSSDEFRYLFLRNTTPPIVFIGDLQPLVYAYKNNQQKILLGLEMYPTSFFSCDLQTRKVEKVQALCKLHDKSETGFYVVPWTCSSALS